MSWRLFSRSLEERFFFFIQRVFIPITKTTWIVRKTGALEKNCHYSTTTLQSLQTNVTNQTFSSKNFNTRKNVSLQLSQHPLKILNGCNIYRTSALLVIMKKGKEETKTWKNFWAAKQINAPTCRIITKKLLDLSKLFWTRKLALWPLYDIPILWL